MKKLIVAWCLFFLIGTFSSCQKENNFIVGTWNLESLTIKYTDDDGRKVEEVVSAVEEKWFLSYTFNSDGTAIANEDGDTWTLSWTLSNSKLVLTEEGHNRVLDFMKTGKKTMDLTEKDEDAIYIFHFKKK